LIDDRNVTVKKNLVTILLLLMAGAYAGFFYWNRLQNRLEVRNESGQTIVELTMTAGAETMTFQNIADGKVAKSRFEITEDCYFSIKGHLEDGTAIDVGLGRMEEGDAGVRATFVIRSDGGVDFTMRRPDA